MFGPCLKSNEKPVKGFNKRIMCLDFHFKNVLSRSEWRKIWRNQEQMWGSFLWLKGRGDGGLDDGWLWKWRRSTRGRIGAQFIWKIEGRAMSRVMIRFMVWAPRYHFSGRKLWRMFRLEGKEHEWVRLVRWVWSSEKSGLEKYAWDLYQASLVPPHASF